MIDNFSLALSHGLLLLAAWRLLSMKELDQEAPPRPTHQSQAWSKDRPPGA